jgi:8-oxo-dGTP pyrophosphatase MutT (NUDIX family)
MSLAERLRAALASAPPAELLERDHADLIATEIREAAVLVPVTDRPEPGLILTLRPDNMRLHAGQIAFPGGRIDPEDANPTAAALREAWEELGLDPSLVEVVGEADHYLTITGYHVTPIVGIVPPELELNPHEGEVADWFEVPLAHVLDPTHHKQVTALYQGVTRHYYEIVWEERRIWGATAAMLINLSRRLLRQ